MSDEVTPGAWEIIKTMRALSTDESAPDMVAVEMVQELADIVDRAGASGRPAIPLEDLATLVGIGAIIMKQADIEMKARVDAWVAMNAIRQKGGRR